MEKRFYGMITDNELVIYRSAVGNEELVEVPDYVTAIQSHAFRGESIRNITIPPSVKSIGKNAFEYCNNLRSITFSEGLEELGEEAFLECKKLAAVHLPSTLVKIGQTEPPFDYCNALKSITVAEGNPAYRAVGNCLIDIAERRLIGGCKTSVMPHDGSIVEIGRGAFSRIDGLRNFDLDDSVVKIADRAFFGSGVEFVRMPPSVKSIGAEAYRCSRVRQLKLGNVERIGQNAFDGCEDLEELIIPDSLRSMSRSAFSYCSIKKLRVGSGVEKIPECAFKHNRDLKEVVLSDGVKTIDKDAFANCESIERIAIPASVTYIGKGAFRGCSSLREVSIANPETVVAEDAFRSCPFKYTAQLKDTEQAGDAADFECNGSMLMRYKGTSERVVIPEYVTKLSGKPFANNTTVEEIHIHKGVTSIAVHSFDGCTRLRTLTVDSANKKLRSEGNCIIDNKTNTLIVGCNGSVIPKSGISAIGASAFDKRRELKNAVIPKGVTSIGVNAFYGCTELKEVVFPDGLETVDKLAFRGCKNLVKAVFGKGLKDIKSEAFRDCISLEILEFADLECVSYQAFSGCSKLTRLVFPEGTKTFKSLAFENCTGLISISLPSTVEEIDTNSFPHGPSLESITVAEGNSVYSGKGNCITHFATKYCKPFYTVITGCKNSVIPTDMGIVAIYSAFEDCVGLTEVVIPDGVAYTFGGSFSGCTGLKRLTVPDTLNYFEIFNDCISLEHVTAPKRMWDYFKTINADVELDEK